MKIKPLFSLIPFFILLILMYVPTRGSDISEAQLPAHLFLNF